MTSWGRNAIWIVVLARQAHAAKHPRFEPTDLEIEKPGTSEIDLQFGGVRGSDRWRAVAPDFELDLGRLDTLELDLDGAYAVQGTTSVPDNLWPSLRVALGDWHNRASDRWFALGAQAGPKLPVARGASGVGFEGLALIGLKSDPLRDRQRRRALGGDRRDRRHLLHVCGLASARGDRRRAVVGQRAARLLAGRARRAGIGQRPLRRAVRRVA